MNEKNKSIFIKNPEKYLPQFGGYGAFRMGQGLNGNPPGKYSINPEYFIISNNKLYLFHYSNAQFLNRWKQNKKKNLENANKIWELISQQN